MSSIPRAIAALFISMLLLFSAPVCAADERADVLSGRVVHRVGDDVGDAPVLHASTAAALYVQTDYGG